MNEEEDSARAPPDTYINSLLCFIVNKIDILPPKSLVKLCVGSYSDKKIEDAKSLIFRLLHDDSNSTKFINRHATTGKETKGEKNLFDIIQLLLEKGTAALPKFVTLDLSELPPITFDSIDVTVLLTKIQNLMVKVELLENGMSDMCSANNAQIEQTKKGMTDLCEANKALQVVDVSLEARVKELEAHGVISVTDTNAANVTDNDSGRNTCETVNVTENDTSDLTIEGEIVEIPFACTECGDTFTSETSLSDHMATPHANAPLSKPFACTDCGEAYSCESDLRNHTASLHPSDTLSMQFTCTVCGFVYTSECMECQYGLDDDNSKNIRNGDNADEKSFNCDECEINFKNKDEMVLHDYIHRPYSCTECDYRSASSSDCHRHIMNHSGVRLKLISCCMCTDKFATQDELRSHMAMHTESKSATGLSNQHLKGNRGGQSSQPKTSVEPRLNKNNVKKTNTTKPDTATSAGGSGAWNLDEEARQRFIESLSTDEGWSRPIMNGKPMKTKDMLKSKDNRAPHNSAPQNSTNKRKSSGNVGAGRDSKISITNRKYKAEVFCTRFLPQVDEEDVKRVLEADLLRVTNTQHTVTVTKLQAKYDHYASFKVTCFCENTAVFMKKDIWPPAVLFRWWRKPRNTNSQS